MLIDRKLKLLEARKLGVIVSEENLSHELARVASLFDSRAEFSEALQQRGITQEDVEKYLMEEIMIREMVKRKFRLFLEVTDLEAADFFERNRQEFVILEGVNLDRIFFRLPPSSFSIPFSIPLSRAPR